MIFYLLSPSQADFEVTKGNYDANWFVPQNHPNQTGVVVDLIMFMEYMSSCDLWSQFHCYARVSECNSSPNTNCKSTSVWH